MPAMLEDPDARKIYRISGAPPYPSPGDAQMPDEVVPRVVTLRDRVTVASIVPFASVEQVPSSLLAYLCDQLNREIELGDTYPMLDPMPVQTFGPYWFSNFGAVMLLGEIEKAEDVQEGKDWRAECLGSFYIKPNYPGRSSHVCNGGFLVTDAARGRGVGRLMGEVYVEWAPLLGYTYSVFNLVYETNVASCRIWDALGFKRIGRVKGCGNLKSYPDQYIDAIIYGRDLGPEGEDFVSEERFDKIKFYLKHAKYPNGADRAEKSRLRSAATHYKLAEGDKLMLKDKEVISDPHRQYEIARIVHMQQHGGINKTTAAIADKFHWVRIKETVGLVIRNCVECKELAKAPVVRAEGPTPRRPNGHASGQSGVSAAGRALSFPGEAPQNPLEDNRQAPPNAFAQQLNTDGMQQLNHAANTGLNPAVHMHQLTDYSDIPVDPQLVDDMHHHLAHYNPAAMDTDPSAANSIFGGHAAPPPPHVHPQHSYEGMLASHVPVTRQVPQNMLVRNPQADGNVVGPHSHAALEAARAAQNAMQDLSDRRGGR
ncbi:MAG: hypothetical protein M1825_004900 [Sarcosagium campestre]|nr:MAG: hypothetical protein M1825_004900 [Sarcosagium campestre]